MQKDSKKIKKYALGKHLRACKSIIPVARTLDLDIESPIIHELLHNATHVYYPGSMLEPLFRSTDKVIFPKNFYAFMGNKIRQTLLFQWLGIPHPKTKIYYGKNLEDLILCDFSFPFVAKRAVGGSQGKEVFLIKSESDLLYYLARYYPPYIQEYIPAERDLRIVLFAGRVIHAYWRKGNPGDFRHNVSQGGTVSFEDIPEGALDFAKWVVRVCGFDEVGLDILHTGNRYLVLEANMVYGLEGFRRKGINIQEIFMQADIERWL